MKNYKFTFLIILGLIFTACDLEEEPPFLSNENVYGSAKDATSALDGIYAGLAEYNYYGQQFITLVNFNSGFMVTKKGGNNNRNNDNLSICSLKPTQGQVQSENSWAVIYQSIGRSNDAIQSAVVTDNPTTNDELVINDVIGQAYFIRAFNYFNLVRLWGEVPLRTAPTTKETVHLAKSPVKEIYTQIISDAAMALQLMNASVGNGKARPQAVNMLLAKVYMTLATAPAEYQESGLNYWQLAYNEASKVYGEYALVSDYASLFTAGEGDNTEESIFELQFSLTASNDHVRAFTPSNSTLAGTFGWLYVNAIIYDEHADTYPNDPRINTTFLSTFINAKNGKTVKLYPDNPSRSSFGNGFPFLYKLGAKDASNEIRETTLNFKIYRYAELLLMLAEISNELQNGEELGYVSEVLSRNGLSAHAGYTNGQEDFRKAIMKEYQFELLGEATDWFNNRRRGYTHFLENVINPHNNYEKFKGNVDVTHSTDETSVMYLPFPASEINTNEEISE